MDPDFPYLSALPNLHIITHTLLHTSPPPTRPAPHPPMFAEVSGRSGYNISYTILIKGKKTFFYEEKLSQNVPSRFPVTPLCLELCKFSCPKAVTGKGKSVESALCNPRTVSPPESSVRGIL